MSRFSLLLLLIVLPTFSCKKVVHKRFEVIPGRFGEVVATANHTCVLDKAGRARCLGRDTTHAMRTTPTVALRAIATGRRLACGVTASDGAVVCWGACDAGGCDAPKDRRGFVALAVADAVGGCAWTAAGELTCWGDGLEFRAPPPRITGAKVKQVALGTGWGLALKRDGTLDAWGEQDVPKDPALQRRIADKSRYERVAGRGAVACAIDASRAMECWVHLGNQSPPVKANVIDAAFSNPMGAIPACALVAAAPAAAGTIQCTRTMKDEPLSLPGEYVQLAAGDHHVCGLTAGGEVKCAGSISMSAWP